MRVWITGGQGMLGHALRRLLGDGHELHVTDREVDIADEVRVRGYAADARVDAIYNCAAYTAVDQAEDDTALAERVNVVGPRVLGTVARSLRIPIVHVSTDYVFAGDARRPYVEDDETGPVSVYGRTKRDGERALLEAVGDGRGYVVRSSWLFGRDGKSFVSTMLSLMKDREALRVVDDQIGRPTCTDDLAAAMAGLVVGAAPPGLYHFANAGQTSWHGFAAAILEGSRRRGWPLLCRAVEPIPTSAYPTKARRPAWSVLDTAKIEATLGTSPRPWQAALDAHLDHLARAAP